MFDRTMWLALSFIALAAVGGLLGSLIRALDGTGGIRWFVVFVETLASAFTGIIIMLLCQYMNLDIRLTGVVVGVCGWVGGRTAMVWLEKRVRRLIGGS